MSTRLVRRREILYGAGGLAATLLIPRVRVRAREGATLSEETLRALAASPLVYISPLHSGDRESRCHGEVWFFFDEGDVLISTGRSTWKARALESGRDRARIWVGDFGRGRGVGERYRKGPSLLTRARVERDRGAFERLLAAFGKKYPDEWGKWEPRFKKGFEDGSRILIRYAPIAP
jgi:hypothetical protein